MNSCRGARSPQMILAAAVLSACAGTEPEPHDEAAEQRPAGTSRIAELVARLGDDDPAVREAAETELLACGMNDLPEIRARVESPDIEVRTRLRGIVVTLEAQPNEPRLLIERMAESARLGDFEAFWRMQSAERRLGWIKRSLGMSLEELKALPDDRLGKIARLRFLASAEELRSLDEESAAKVFVGRLFKNAEIRAWLASWRYVSAEVRRKFLTIRVLDNSEEQESFGVEFVPEDGEWKAVQMVP